MYHIERFVKVSDDWSYSEFVAVDDILAFTASIGLKRGSRIKTHGVLLNDHEQEK